jgi:5'-deoxynucleotidase YfbR-like HD superfamily hydrolase
MKTHDLGELLARKPRDVSISDFLGEHARQHPIRCGDIHFVKALSLEEETQRLLHPGQHPPAAYTVFSGPFVNMPHSTFNHACCSEDHETVYAKAPGLARLQRIKQLSILANPMLAPAEQCHHDLIFPHTREGHSLLAAAYAETMMVISGKSRNETKKVVVAALLHDVATVAGGDAMKMVAPEELDEEMLAERLLKRDPILPFLREEKLDPDEILAIIRNEGLLGKVLDLVDRLSYTALDSFHFSELYHLEDEATADWPQHIKYYQEKGRAATQIVDTTPNLFDFIFDFRVTDDGVCCRDAEALGKFLELRAVMHRDLYLDAYAHIAEVFLAPYCDAVYRKQGVERLLEMDNRELYDEVAKLVGHDSGASITPWMEQLLQQYDVHIDELDTEENVADFKETLTRMGRVPIHELDFRRGFNSNTNLLVCTNEGTTPFYVEQPAIAQRIEQIVDQVKTIRVYHARPYFKSFL